MDNSQCTLESNERQEAALNLPPKNQSGAEVKSQSPLRRMLELLEIWIPCRHLNGNPHCRKCGPAYQEYLKLARLEGPRGCSGERVRAQRRFSGART
jgi:hypothetical protein